MVPQKGFMSSKFFLKSIHKILDNHKTFYFLVFWKRSAEELRADRSTFVNVVTSMSATARKAAEHQKQDMILFCIFGGAHCDRDKYGFQRFLNSNFTIVKRNFGQLSFQFFEE